MKFRVESKKNERRHPSEILAALASVTETFGTFQGSTTEFSCFCHEQFESEVSLKGLLRKLVGMISSWIGLNEVGFLSLNANPDSLEGQSTEITFPGCTPISNEVIAQIRELIFRAGSLAHIDAKGAFQIKILGRNYWCARFVAPQKSEGLLIWTSADWVRITPGALLGPESGLNVDVLTVLVEAAQMAARWLQRLDAAQSLLYEDDVTGLFNYRYLDVALDSEFRRLQRFHSPFSLLFIDLDNFKQVNDLHGHMTGSSILRQVGTQIKGALRDVDVVIRYGGDEFVVVLLGTNSNQAIQAAERVRSRVEQFRFSTGAASECIHLTVSIGVASCPEHARDKSTVLKLADDTMYAAKRSGKNRVVMLKARSSNENVQNLTLPRGGR